MTLQRIQFVHNGYTVSIMRENPVDVITIKITEIGNLEVWTHSYQRKGADVNTILTDIGNAICEVKPKNDIKLYDEMSEWIKLMLPICDALSIMIF